MALSTVSPVEAGPRRVSRRVTVGAAAGDLFAIAADPRRHGELDGSGTVGDAVEVSLPLLEGATSTGSRTRSPAR
jgi:hypothetical protein